MRSSLLRLAASALPVITLCLPIQADEPKPKDAPTDKPGYFFAIPDAKDCAYDQLRGRLYVTTPQKLVVADTKTRKSIESVELPGGLQGCDIAPDFSFVAVAPASAQHVFKVGLKWEKFADIKITQIKFKAPSAESGVHGLCVGSDGVVLFSTTYDGSGGVSLRRINQIDKVEESGQIRMDSVLTASPDRRFAAITEGNISTGPLKTYDFRTKRLLSVADLGGFPHEIACARGAKYFARPHNKGCDILDAKGTRLDNLEGDTVFAAAFHPTTDALFVLRNRELSLQEYEVPSGKLKNKYSLEEPLFIKGDGDVDVQPVGKDPATANFRFANAAIIKAYRSGRVKISEDGKWVFAVIPSGVYMIPVKTTAAGEEKPKPKIKVIEAPKK